MSSDLGKDHGGRVTRLHRLAVQLKRHVEGLRVCDLVTGHEVRARRAEGVAGFALGPLAGEVLLEFAFRHIVDDAVTRHAVQRVCFGDVCRIGWKPRIPQYYASLLFCYRAEVWTDSWLML